MKRQAITTPIVVGNPRQENNNEPDYR
jgi:hypothetical protein